MISVVHVNCNRKVGIKTMSDYNKVLWALAIISINGLFTVGLRYIKSDIAVKVIVAVFWLIILFVSISWVFFDYWV